MEDCTAHSLICDVAVLAEGSVLMLRYADPAKYDGESGWFLPDDVLREFEHPTRAAVRILKEQLALEVEDEPRLGLIESFQGNDESWHLSFHHVVELPGSPHLRPAKGIAAAQALLIGSMSAAWPAQASRRSIPGVDVRLTNDAPALGGYVSAYTLGTGNAYTDSTLDECSVSRGRQNEPAVEVDPRNQNVLI